MRNTGALHELLSVGSMTFILSLLVFGIIKSNSYITIRSQENSSAQTIPCTQATLTTIGQISFAPQIQYESQVTCLTPGTGMYLHDDRFTFFSTPTSLQAKQVAFIRTENVSLKADHQLSWNVQITQSADVFVFYRKIPGQTVPAWLSAFTRVTTDSYATLQPFLLRKNEQGLIGVYDIYQKTVTGATTVNFGAAYSSTGEAFSMYLVGVSPRSGSQTATPVPTTQTPLPSGQVKAGIWISQAEIMNLSVTGAAWEAVSSTANGVIGTANIADQDSSHPEKTVAVALAAVRLNSESLKNKAVSALLSAIGTENNPDPDCASPKYGARGLAVGRNLFGYAVAADILNFRAGGYDPNGSGTKFQQWMDAVRHRKNCDSNGAAAYSSSIMDTPGTTSNGNSLTLASRIAAAGYLRDKTDADIAWLAYRRYAGDSSVGPNYVPNSYSANWKSTTVPNYVGINPKGAHCSGSSFAYPADGVLPNDQGRGGNCPTDPSRAPAYGSGSQYPWEGLQGAYAQAVVYSRLGYRDSKGLDAWQVSDKALLRAVQYQCQLRNMPPYTSEWYDSSRAAWVKHLAYVVYGFRCKVQNTGLEIIPSSSGGGRNIDFAQWTFPKI